MKKTQNKQTKLGNKGFSLVELIVVIAIMAVLVGILAPVLLNNIAKSKESKDITALDTVYTAIVNAYGDEAGNSAFTTTAAYGTGKVITLTTVLGGTDDFAKLVREYSGLGSTQPALAGNVSIGTASGAVTAANTHSVKFIVSAAGKVTVALSDQADGAATVFADTTSFFGDKGDKHYTTD